MDCAHSFCAASTSASVTGWVAAADEGADTVGAAGLVGTTLPVKLPPPTIVVVEVAPIFSKAVVKSSEDLPLVERIFMVAAGARSGIVVEDSTAGRASRASGARATDTSVWKTKKRIWDAC